MSEPTRIALVGTGGMAEACHLPAIRDLGPQAELVAVADIDPERAYDFARRHRAGQAYEDVEQLLREHQPDLVHLCTPPSTHAQLAITAMRAGAWVYCEKPPCRSLAELDEIAAAERQTGQWCSFVFQLRFGSGAVHLRRLIAEGRLGRPLLAMANTTWFRDTSYYDVPWRGRWDTEAGGTTMMHGIHAIDLLLWLLGGWREVRAIVARVDREIETEDVSLALAELECGARASIVTSVVSPREESYLRLDFQHATVELRHLYGYTNVDWVYTPRPGLGDPQHVETWRRIPGEIPASHATQLRAIVDSRRRGQPPPTTTAEVRDTMEFVTALYRSAKTGVAVERGAVRPHDAFYQRLDGGAA